jgi:hypothetical protein
MQPRDRGPRRVDLVDAPAPEPSGTRTREERNVNIKLYSAKGCPFARRTRVVLHEKGIEFRNA